MTRKCVKKSVFKIVRLLLINIIVAILLVGSVFIATKKIALTYIAPITMFISIFISLHVIEKRSFKDIGLNFRPKDILLLLAGMITSCTFYMIILLFSNHNNFSEYINVLTSCASRGPRGLIGVLVVPLTEELFFRGYILKNTFEDFKFYQISLISAALFSIGHWQYIPGTPIIMFLLINMAGTFLFGLLFNNIAKITKTVWFTVGLHCFYNYLGLIIFKGSTNLPLWFILTTLIFISLGILITSIFTLKQH